MLDRFTTGSKFEGLDSPWDKNDRAHEFEDKDFNKLFDVAHQVDSSKYLQEGATFPSPDPTADKIVINFDRKDLLFAERCGFYRNPGWDDDQSRYEMIISNSNQDFVKKSFGDVHSSKSVAKELLKIKFHDITKHKWYNEIQKLIKDKENYQFQLMSLLDVEKLEKQFEDVSKAYDLNLKIDRSVLKNVVDKIKQSHVVKTKDRAQDILGATNGKIYMPINDLDILEQAYIEAELEKYNETIMFPYGTNFFDDTGQINDFLDTFPNYLKHMNPRVKWHNNIKNGYHISDEIDK